MPFQSPTGLRRSWIFPSSSDPCEPNINPKLTTAFTCIVAIPSNTSPNSELFPPGRISLQINFVCLLDPVVIFSAPLSPGIRPNSNPSFNQSLEFNLLLWLAPPSPATLLDQLFPSEPLAATPAFDARTHILSCLVTLKCSLPAVVPILALMVL